MPLHGGSIPPAQRTGAPGIPPLIRSFSAPAFSRFRDLTSFHPD